MNDRLITREDILIYSWRALLQHRVEQIVAIRLRYQSLGEWALEHTDLLERIPWGTQPSVIARAVDWDWPKHLRVPADIYQKMHVNNMLLVMASGSYPWAT